MATSDNTEFRRQIENAVEKVPGSDFLETSENLLKVLGYSSDRKHAATGNVDDFISDFKSLNTNTKSEQRFREEVKSVRIIFQITDKEIDETARMQGVLMDAERNFDTGNTKSFIFVAVELKNDVYPRSKYAEFTREINKRFPMPIVATFRTASDALTLSFVHRRQHKRTTDRDVLGNVSLIREIDTMNPHRAHIDILSELRFKDLMEWMRDNAKSINFDGLLAAWLAKLDIQELNKRFYRDLFAWFNRAVKQAKFPTDRVKTEEHVIRLITRLLFVWFIKEKNLVDDDLFDEIKIKVLLRDYDPKDGDSYYRAVLQNLFFATLNTEINERGFSSRSNDTHRIFSLYRYKDEMKSPDELLKLFDRTPFINGGLFDCLDTEKAEGEGGYRIDCFSDNKKHSRRLSIPNRFFFDNSGLITIFNSYKFTIEENTPAEQEVALDPELLGRVFENLLATIVPETGESARKMTGSYYTPRPIVDYMVHEALIASLAQKCNPTDSDREFLEERLRYLFDYNDDYEDAEELFDESEKKSIVRAIAEIKTLDPAVGSGAFPMGILHKLTLALQRLDPNNERWEDLQKKLAQERAKDAFDIEDQKERDSHLQEISDIFDHYRYSDFGRKLYLIQNSIFGVDIQPVATQIAKLRFFISLAIEQEPNNNYGIKPLPNLETRFISADSLVEIRDETDILKSVETERLENEINQNRERYFHANSRSRKLRLKENDKRLRKNLAKELARVGVESSEARKIAQWDLFDQNTKADWFNAGRMFGINDGFDLVIANPPYINVENLSDKMRQYLLNNYETCEKRTDIYIAFLDKSMSNLNEGGFMSFIIPFAFTTQPYAAKMRRKLVEKHSVCQIVDASAYRIFKNASVYNIVLLISKERNNKQATISLYQSNDDFRNRTGTVFTRDQDLFLLLKDYRFDTNPETEKNLQLRAKIWGGGDQIGSDLFRCIRSKTQ